MNPDPVLIVADDQQLACLIRDILESDGFQTRAASGLYQTAHSTGETDSSPRAAVVDASTLLIEDAVQILAAFLPAMRLLILSDCVTDGALTPAGANLPHAKILRKPFAPAVLLSAFRSLLNE